MFNFLGDLVSATIKVAMTPIAVVKDVVNVVVGVEPDSTKNQIESIGKDLESSLDNLTGVK